MRVMADPFVKLNGQMVMEDNTTGHFQAAPAPPPLCIHLLLSLFLNFPFSPCRSLSLFLSVCPSESVYV